MKNEKKPERAKRSLLGGIKNVFVRQEGGLRTGWLLLCAVILYRCVSYGLRFGLNTVFEKLFSAWRVNAGNIHLAPYWAQIIWSWHGSIITAAVCIVSVLLSLVMRRWWLKNRRIAAGVRPGLVYAGVGAGIALVAGALFLILDSMRPEWPLAEPGLTMGLVVMLPVTLFTAFAEELFNKCVIFDLAADRMKRVWACAISAIVFFLFNGGYAGTVLSGINVLLMGIVCCMLYQRYGLLAAALFRGAWSYASVFVVGFGATSAAQSVYALYGVSENWLTGGDGGMIYGVWMTVMLAGMMAWMHRKVLSECAKAVAERSRSKKRDKK